MICIRPKTYNYQLINQSVKKITKIAERTGVSAPGSIPLPTKKEIVTTLRAVHKYRDSHEQSGRRTHKHPIDILKPFPKVVEALMFLELLTGIEVEIKL